MGVYDGDLGIKPPNILGALDSIDKYQQRQADARKDEIAIQLARRKLAMEEQAGQYMAGAIKGDPDAIGALLRLDPTRGMAVVQWHANRDDRELQRRILLLRGDALEKKAGGGGGGVAGPSPWAPASGSPSAPVRVPPQGGVPQVQPGRTADASGSMDLTMPQVAGPPQGSSGGVAPTDMLPGPLLMREGSVNPPMGYVPPDAGPSAPAGAPQGARPGTRPGGPEAYGLPVDAYAARDQGYIAVLDKHGKPVESGNRVWMWKPGVAGSAISLPYQQDREPRPESNWVPDPSRPGVLVDTKTGNTKRDPGHQDPGGGPSGNSMDAWATRVLLDPNADPSSPQYARAYAHAATPKATVNEEGRVVFIRPDMSDVRPPTSRAQGAPPGPAGPPAAPPSAGAPQAAPPAGAPPAAPQAPPQGISPQDEINRARNVWMMLDRASPQERADIIAQQGSDPAVRAWVARNPGGQPPQVPPAAAPPAMPPAASSPGTPTVEVVQGRGKNIPDKVLTGLDSDVQSVRQIDRALAALKQYPEGVGAIPGLSPDWLIQRRDPDGVTLRALIADIGSLKIHDRSGAAVTAAETPRLRPFIPSVGDTPDTIRKKLIQFRQQYQDQIRDTNSYYNEAGGYRPHPSAGGVGDAAPPGGGPAAPRDPAQLDKLKRQWGLE